MLSQREAVERFTALGLDRESARRVLVCGLVPPVRRGRGTTLYDERDVQAFLDRQRTDLPPWEEQFVVVLRTQPRRADADSPVGWSGIDLTAPREEQLVAARAGGRGMSGVTQAYVALRAERDGAVPMLATVGGFVALAAEILGAVPRDDSERRRPAWRLRAAGPWAEQWLGLFLPTGRGGSSWRILGSRTNVFVSRPRGVRTTL